MYGVYCKSIHKADFKVVCNLLISRSVSSNEDLYCIPVILFMKLSYQLGVIVSVLRHSFNVWVGPRMRAEARVRAGAGNFFSRRAICGRTKSYIFNNDYCQSRSDWKSKNKGLHVLRCPVFH